MAQRLRTRCAATHAEALRRDARGRALSRRLRKRYGATPADTLCGDPMRKHSDAMHCGRALMRRLRKRYGATTAEAL